MSIRRLALLVAVLSAAGCSSSPYRPLPTPPPHREVTIPFAGHAVDVFPFVGDVLVVAGDGTVDLPGGDAVVRQEGSAARFVVERVGVTRITIYRRADRMDIYVRSQPTPPS